MLPRHFRRSGPIEDGRPLRFRRASTSLDAQDIWTARDGRLMREKNVSSTGCAACGATTALRCGRVVMRWSTRCGPWSSLDGPPRQEEDRVIPSVFPPPPPPNVPHYTQACSAAQCSELRIAFVCSLPPAAAALSDFTVSCALRAGECV